MTNEWQSDAAIHLDRFLGAEALCDEDALTAASFARRIGIDPYDVPARNDSTSGAFYARVGKSQIRPDLAIWATWMINHELQLINFVHIGYQRDNAIDWDRD